MAGYFDQFQCGVGYDAMGNGGWSACYRLEGGMAACNPLGSPGSAQMVTWSSGSPVTNVAHITAVGDLDVVVVTEDGAAYKGHMSNLSETPIISEGAISATGGKNPMCIMVENGDKKDVLCGNDLTRPALPADFDVMQVTAAYGFVCALDKTGEVWCWTSGGNSGLDSIIGATPANVGFEEPMVFIGAGQNSICGVKESGGLACKFSYYDNRFLPAQEMASPAVTPDDFHPDAKAVQLAYGKGVVINNDGSAVYYPGGAALSGVGKVVSAGGDRAAISVVNEAGEVFVVDGGSASKVDVGLRAEAPTCAR